MSKSSSCSTVVEPLIKEAVAKFQKCIEELRPDTLFELICSGLNQLATFAKEILKICSTNGIVDEELRDLEVLLNAALVKGRSYISTCRDMADFAADDELVEAIKADVMSGGTNELREFFEVMEEHWQDCEKQLNEFNSSFRDAIGKAESKTKHYHKEATKSRASRDKAVTEVTTHSAIATVGFGVAAMSLGPGTVLFSIVVGITSVKNATKAVLDGFNAQKLKGVAEEAEKCATCLHGYLSDAKEQVDNVEGAMTGVRSALDRLNRRREKDGSKKMIETLLKQLNKKMKEIASKAEESLQSLPQTLASLR